MKKHIISGSLVIVVLFISALLFSGCGVNLFTTQKEIEMGNSLSEEVKKQHQLVKSPEVNRYISDLGNKVSAVCDRQDITYKFNVIKNDTVVNAFAMPGGHIYVYTGLLYKMENEAELVGVLAHEVGHVVKKHSMIRLSQMYGAAFLTSLALGKNAPEWQQIIAQMFTGLGMLKYGRENEYEADRQGVTYLSRTGYNPDGMVTLLEKFNEMNSYEPSKMEQLLSTHPPAKERIVKAREFSGTLSGSQSGKNNENEYKNFITLLKRSK